MQIARCSGIIGPDRQNMAVALLCLPCSALETQTVAEVVMKIGGEPAKVKRPVDQSFSGRRVAALGDQDTEILQHGGIFRLVFKDTAITRLGLG